MDTVTIDVLEDSCRSPEEDEKVSSSSQRRRLLGTLLRPPVVSCLPVSLGIRYIGTLCGTALSFVIFMILALLEGRLLGIFLILFLATALCWGHPDITCNGCLGVKHQAAYLLSVWGGGGELCGEGVGKGGQGNTFVMAWNKLHVWIMS